MKRFAWRLQRVLDVKEVEEQVKRRELLELTEAFVQTLEELLQQRKILDNVILEITHKDSLSRLREQELFLRYAAKNNNVITELEQKLKNLESQKNEKISEIAAVRKAKEGLEKLRAKAKEEFINEQERLDAKELDEVATVSFARNAIQQISMPVENQVIE
jgi:flagellar export protein FliJ